MTGDAINHLLLWLQLLGPFLMVAVAAAILIRDWVKRQEQVQPAAQTITDDRLVRVVDKLQRRVDELEDKWMLWQAYAARLAAQVVELGGKPILLDEIRGVQSGAILSFSRDPFQLLNVLNDKFSIDELDAIALELGAKVGELGVGNLKSRANALLQYAENNNKLFDLALIVWRERPNIQVGK